MEGCDRVKEGNIKERNPITKGDKKNLWKNIVALETIIVTQF